MIEENHAQRITKVCSNSRLPEVVIKLLLSSHGQARSRLRIMSKQRRMVSQISTLNWSTFMDIDVSTQGKIFSTAIHLKLYTWQRLSALFLTLIQIHRNSSVLDILRQQMGIVMTSLPQLLHQIATPLLLVKLARTLRSVYGIVVLCRSLRNGDKDVVAVP